MLTGECLGCKHGYGFGVLGGFQCRVCSGIGHKGNLSVNTARELQRRYFLKRQAGCLGYDLDINAKFLEFFCVIT